MRYVLDTNIILFYLKDEETKRHIKNTYDPFNKDNEAIISAVTIGEIRSLAVRNGWGEKRISLVEKIMEDLIVVDVSFNELFDAYASSSQFSSKQLVFFSPKTPKGEKRAVLSCLAISPSGCRGENGQTENCCAYAEIEAFCEGKHPQRPVNRSSRILGKNDLWIAATTYVTNSKLLTADKDFLPINGEYFEVIMIDRENIKGTTKT